MTYLEAIGLVGTMTTILGVFLVLYGIFNNRTLKREARDTRQMITE
jgi:predicted transporter